MGSLPLDDNQGQTGTICCTSDANNYCHISLMLTVTSEHILY